MSKNFLISLLLTLYDFFLKKYENYLTSLALLSNITIHCLQESYNFQKGFLTLGLNKALIDAFMTLARYFALFGMNFYIIFIFYIFICYYKSLYIGSAIQGYILLTFLMNENIYVLVLRIYFFIVMLSMSYLIHVLTLQSSGFIDAFFIIFIRESL